jgi:hypothetical protein
MCFFHQTKHPGHEQRILVLAMLDSKKVIYQAMADSHRIHMAQSTSDSRKGVSIIGGFRYLHFIQPEEHSVTAQL